jgi:hypothetical protein
MNKRMLKWYSWNYGGVGELMFEICMIIALLWITRDMEASHRAVLWAAASWRFDFHDNLLFTPIVSISAVTFFWTTTTWQSSKCQCPKCDTTHLLQPRTVATEAQGDCSKKQSIQPFVEVAVRNRKGLDADT